MAQFGTLDIILNTPYYMTVSGPEEFQWNNPGYELHMDGLPEGELTFTLCAEQEPDAQYYARTFPTELLLVGAAVQVAVMVVIVYARTAKRKKQQ